MTIVTTLDAISEWVRDNICKGHYLKAPTKGKQTAEYEYQEVEPTVYTLYEPTGQDRPPNAKPLIPGICVQLIDGTDLLADQMRSMRLRLSFSTYQPGIHGADWLCPYSDVKTREIRYARSNYKYFSYSEDGWRDVWNLIDRAIRKIENADSIANFNIDHEQGVKFGPFSYQGETPDLYPFWFGFIELTITQKITRNREFQKYL